METAYRKDLPHLFFLSCAAVTGLVVILMFGFIFWTAIPIFRLEGPGFILNTVWDYNLNQYGIFLFIVGTLVLTVVTMIIAIPLGILTAIYLAEFAPPSLEKVLRPLIELLVGIPSIVYGIFGFFYPAVFLPGHGRSAHWQYPGIHTLLPEP